MAKRFPVQIVDKNGKQTTVYRTNAQISKGQTQRVKQLPPAPKPRPVTAATAKKDIRRKLLGSTLENVSKIAKIDDVGVQFSMVEGEPTLNIVGTIEETSTTVYATYRGADEITAVINGAVIRNPDIHETINKRLNEDAIYSDLRVDIVYGRGDSYWLPEDFWEVNIGGYYPTKNFYALNPRPAEFVASAIESLVNSK